MCITTRLKVWFQSSLKIQILRVRLHKTWACLKCIHHINIFTLFVLCLKYCGGTGGTHKSSKFPVSRLNWQRIGSLNGTSLIIYSLHTKLPNVRNGSQQHSR